MTVKGEYFLFFFFCFLILFQAVFLPINFLLFMVIFLALFSQNEGFLFWPFLLGLVYDFIYGGQIGLTSLVLLVIGFLILLYKRKISTFHFLFLPVFSFLSASFFDIIIYRFIRLHSIFILIILSFILSIISKYFDIFKWPTKDEKDKLFLPN